VQRLRSAVRLRQYVFPAARRVGASTLLAAFSLRQQLRLRRGLAASESVNDISHFVESADGAIPRRFILITQMEQRREAA
jgi:hypothetical protein